MGYLQEGWRDSGPATCAAVQVKAGIGGDEEALLQAAEGGKLEGGAGVAALLSAPLTEDPEEAAWLRAVSRQDRPVPVSTYACARPRVCSSLHA
jgi:hypothetical protein